MKYSIVNYICGICLVGESIFLLLPLIVSLKDKTVSVMGNVTCSAAAAGSGVVIGVREFCMLFSLDPAGRNRSSAARTGSDGGG